MADYQPIEGCISRQTEKAILVTITTARGNRRDVWFPMSQIKIEGQVIWVPDWLLTKKRAEAGGIITLDRTVAARMAA